ncbi:hypothetical protein [Colwellia sp. E150_009]
MINNELNVRAKDISTTYYVLITILFICFFTLNTKAEEVSTTNSASSSSIDAYDIAPPKYQTIDDFGVNLTTGQVTTSIDTVAIGGAMGLSHSISAHANGFEYKGFRGYTDKFAGNARYTLLGKSLMYENVSYHNFYVMRLFAPVGSADFKIYVDGTFVPTVTTSVTENYSYEALGDTRETLEVSDDREYLIWTLSDGTIVRFIRDAYDNARSNGALSDITYPNGYKITRHGSRSVTTNTGFQLKYDYIDDSRPLDPAKNGAIGAGIPAESALQWSEHNPKYIVGINNAIEYCSIESSEPCTLTNTWPKATFTWPGGMPRAFHIGQSVFTVNDALARSTELHYEAHDLVLSDLDDPTSINESVSFEPGDKIMPRLVGIKPATSAVLSSTYKYRNKFSYSATGGVSYGWLITELGEVVSATNERGTGAYSLDLPIGQGGPLKNSLSWKGSFYVTRDVTYPTSLYEIYKSGDGIFKFEDNYRNFVEKVSSNSGPQKNYSYDLRGNLEYITMQKDKPEETQIQALYPVTCDNTKVCNKPKWIKNALKKQTDYTYHPESGQVETVTSPANKQGITPQTRYTYTEKFATYKINSNTAETSPDGIWLLTAQKHCQNSNYIEGVCEGSDEVVISYEYGTSNLLLKGKSISADGKTLRTCYDHDIYGNKIGETKPKAGVTTCL